MALERIRKGDLVEVIAGRDRGKSGRVLEIETAKNRVIVEKLNLVKRHTRPRKQGEQGGILEKEAPIHLSSVLPFCAKCGRGVRVKTAVSKGKKGDVEKTRVCVRCGETVKGQ